MKTEKFELIAKTLQGLEDVLAEEIIALGGEEVEQGKRMVSFVGDKELMYKANLHLRTALRILKPIKTFMASNTDEVYDFLKSLKWEDYLSPDQTVSIDTVVYSDNFRHSKFVTYRAKDAIADYFSEKYGKRPSVCLTGADLMLNLHIAGHTCTLSLDSSGESLHRRGYRVAQTEAPLNEVLAAGMILKTGWKGEKNFIDPMCGSGTLLIEAAMIATNTPPGIYRQGFAFEKWNDYDADLFDSLYNDESNERNFDFKIYGSDISPRAIEIARENIKSAGFSKYIDLKVMPFQQYTAETVPADAVLVTNPPYGERISSRDILGLYELLGSTLKHQFKGYEAWILSYREECFEKIGLRPSVKFELMNGGLDCEYRKYEIFDGKLKDFKKEGGELSKEEAEREIPESDNRNKREIRKARFANTKPSRGAGRGKEERAVGGKPARRESTFKKGFDAPAGDRKESKSGRPDFKKGGADYKKGADFKAKRFGGDDDRAVFRGNRSERPFREGRSERSDFKPEGFKRPSRYDQSGNFRRNADGKLEQRTDGEFKPRGERTFNPNHPRFVPRKDNGDEQPGNDNE